MVDLLKSKMHGYSMVSRTHGGSSTQHLTPHNTAVKQYADGYMQLHTMIGAISCDAGAAPATDNAASECSPSLDDNNQGWSAPDSALSMALFTNSEEGTRYMRVAGIRGQRDRVGTKQNQVDERRKARHTASCNVLMAFHVANYEKLYLTRNV